MVFWYCCMWTLILPRLGSPFPLYLSQPLSSSWDTGTTSILQTKSHIVCDNGITDEQYAWVRDSVAKYTPSIPSDVQFVRIPSIFQMDMMMDPNLTEDESGHEEMPSSSMKMEMVSGMKTESSPNSWFQRMKIPFFSKRTTKMSTLPSSSSSKSVYHRLRFDSSPYKEMMSYARYCALEERVARITQNYVADTRRHFCLLMEPSLMHADSVMSFWTRPQFDRTIRITTDHHIGNPDLVIWTDRPTGTL